MIWLPVVSISSTDRARKRGLALMPTASFARTPPAICRHQPQNEADSGGASAGPDEADRGMMRRPPEKAASATPRYSQYAGRWVNARCDVLSGTDRRGRGSLSEEMKVGSCGSFIRWVASWVAFALWLTRRRHEVTRQRFARPRCAAGFHLGRYSRRGKDARTSHRNMWKTCFRTQGTGTESRTRHH